MIQFLHFYVFIGLIIYVVLTSAMYYFGIDNIKRELDNEEVKKLSETSIIIGLLLFSITIWPIIVIWAININNKNK